MDDLLKGRQRYGSTFTDPAIMEVGFALGIDFEKIDGEEFRKGFRHELEHGYAHPETNVTYDDPVATAKIALAHLTEDPEYYTKLEEIEK